MKKDFVCIKDWSVKEMEEIFALAFEVKKAPEKFCAALKGKSLALVFEKPSTRTYVSFQVGMYQLGGNSLYLGPEQAKLGVRESVHDVAKTLSRYVDGIVLRTFAHKNVVDMAKYARVPVINGLSDLLHPCQAMADIFTMKEIKGKLKGINLAFVGDGNNVLHSLLYGCAKLGINLFIAAPKGYTPEEKILEEAEVFAKKNGALIKLTREPEEAVRDCEFLYTDVWASMGQEKEYAQRIKDFQGYQLNTKLLAKAKKPPYILHCLPAHRGEEITDAVIDSKKSLVFEQAENRLHVQKAILITLIK